MDKVKTYVSGIANGIRDAFDNLDVNVKKLGNIEIKSVVDKYILIGEESGRVDPSYEAIVRTIVYKTLDNIL